MYHVNPAVTKALLMRLDKKSFICEIDYIKQRAIDSKPGTTERAKFVRLYLWSVNYYQSNHQKPPFGINQNKRLK